MGTYIPLSQLMTTGRDPAHRVGHQGHDWLLWQDFQTQVAAYAFVFAHRAEQRWLLIADEPLTFATQLLALLHAGKNAVIPPNIQPGTLNTLRSQYDAIVDFKPPADQQGLHALDVNRPCISLYTSGSTAEPKAIQKNLRQLDAELSLLEAQWGEDLGHCSVLGTAPHHHLYGLTFRVLWPLAAGRPTDNVTCAHPDQLAERLLIMGEGLWVSSPAQLSRWPDLISLENLQPKPRMVLSSGGPLSAAAASRLHQQLGWPPVEIYGSSETGVIAWRCQATDGLWNPFSGIRLHTDEAGALMVHSPLLEGDSTLRMDDAVDLTPDGRFSLKGRLDRTVKIEEKRLFLPDMEEHLCRHAVVSSAALTPLESSRQSLGAVVVLKAQGDTPLTPLTQTGRRELIQQLRQHLLQHFDPVLIPRRWRFPEQLPFNERGKLTQDALSRMFDHE